MIDRLWFRSAGLAAIAGARGMLGPALAARARAGHPRLRAGLYALAAGEFLADKLPFIPARTDALPLAGRAVSGAAVAVATRPRGGNAVAAALLGAAAAVAGAYVGFTLRRAATRRLGGGPLANAVTGALEEAVLVSVGLRLASRRNRRRWRQPPPSVGELRGHLQHRAPEAERFKKRVRAGIGPGRQ